MGTKTNEKATQTFITALRAIELTLRHLGAITSLLGF